MYNPKPIDTSYITLDKSILELTEKLAEHIHDIWALNRINEGWVYGTQRDDTRKEHPCLVHYKDLPEGEKQYDRDTAIQSLKAILALGYEINKR